MHYFKENGIKFVFYLLDLYSFRLNFFLDPIHFHLFKWGSSSIASYFRLICL